MPPKMEKIFLTPPPPRPSPPHPSRTPPPTPRGFVSRTELLGPRGMECRGGAGC